MPATISSDQFDFIMFNSGGYREFADGMLILGAQMFYWYLGSLEVIQKVQNLVIDT